jgi:NADPH:quinone reductase-like Zn-dependent oxidoreductase
MKAARISQFGSVDVITVAETECPAPGPGQVLVRVKAAGVGPWDAFVRKGKIGIPQSLPLILGSDISGVVRSVGPGVNAFRVGDEIYGVTNEQFTGGYAEYAVAAAGMIARKPEALSFVEAASAPVVAVTAWQMIFEYAQVTAGQTALVQGAAGNVGAYAVQLATRAGVHVIGTAAGRDADYVRELGAEKVIDYSTDRFEDFVSGVDAVIDTVGGEIRERSFGVLKKGGILVSVVSPKPQEVKRPNDVRMTFFIVEVTTARLNRLTALFDSHALKAQVGSVLSLEGARMAHEMLAGAPHKQGKKVLDVGA